MKAPCFDDEESQHKELRLLRLKPLLTPLLLHFDG